MDGTKKSESGTGKPKKPAEGGFKELAESILVAFILAFVFRAFIVEAFVIPTGSMAPTLLGAHMRYACQDCGYSWSVNFNGSRDGDDIVIPPNAYIELSRNHQYVYSDGRREVGPAMIPRVYSIFCPNCGYKLPRNQTTGPAVFYGDRILVQKYLYLLQDPRRWDVVVFKNPEEAQKRNPTNYIKRLIGTPGESIVILDGDIYVSKTTNPELQPTDFTIQTKTPAAQNALWRIVYDNDHRPTGATRADGSVWKQPWTPRQNDGKWSFNEKTGGRVFSCDSSAGNSELEFDPQASPNNRPLTDWLSYDQAVWERSIDDYPQPSYTPAANVSDLKLSLTYTRKSGQGPLRLCMTKRSDTLIAEITPDSVRVIRKNASGETVIGKPVSMRVAQGARIDFQNADYQLTLSIDGKVVIQSTPQEYAPDVTALVKEAQSLAFSSGPAPSVWISADGQVCDIAHLSLWRDAYYLSSNREANFRHAVPGNFPSKVIRLKKDEYFCLGDNSPVSQDGRYWSTRVNLPDEDLDVDSGRVPGRFLMGKAFFVYWPAGYRLSEGSSWSLKPNFGAMRFIH